VSVAGKAPVIVRAPISGVVAGVNESLARNPAPLLTDPCGVGWVACIWMTRFEEETARCKLRRVVVANVFGPGLQAQSQALAALGCQVHGVASREELLAALKEADAGVAVIDAASFGDQGPDLVDQVNLLAPAWRVVVVASPDGRWETAYRQHRIFYYAVDPFADNEVVEILDAAFRLQEVPRPKTSPPSEPGESLSSIATTNRNGHKVRLIAAPGLLQRNEGLGYQIGQRLLERSMRVVVMPGEADLEPTAILKAAGTCDRLMVLTAKDSGQLPGSLARDTKAEFGPASGESARRVTALTVQPDAAGTFAGIDPRIVATLAEHLVREMASY
jgi:DNA-binding NarL/FixJ family response regulator